VRLEQAPKAAMKSAVRSNAARRGELTRAEIAHAIAAVFVLAIALGFVGWMVWLVQD
jgi:hypothetical protein